MAGFFHQGFGCGHMSLIHYFSVFGYLDFGVAKTIHVLLVLIWRFRIHWGILNEICHLYLDLSLILPGSEFCLIILILKVQRTSNPCPLSPDLGLWRTLDVPCLGMAS